ncbi:sensor histidine kinase [Saccharothrix deserti]|uniref:sensor histidine kinase n=1 Tax=Saccharothrix deserti TaxID=2593674 RepID=UPI00131D59BE|nr:sensor histidine kinase [Saccharothrix deserti]
MNADTEADDDGSSTGRRRRFGAESAGYLLHAVFFAVVTGTALRLLDLNEPNCPYIISVSAALAGGYAAGLVWWDRLDRWRPLWIGGLLAPWLALVVLSPASLRPEIAWCAVPLACLAVRALTAKASSAALVVITAVVAFAAVAAPFDPMRVIVPVGAVWAAALLYRRQQRDAAVQQRLLDELHRTRGALAAQQREAGALAERARIARELHDTLTQELAASRTLLQAADRDWQQFPDRARDRMRTVTRYLGDNLVEARRMIADLTPPALDDGDFTAALTDLCARAQESGTAAEVSFHAVGKHRPLPSQMTAALLRVVQGALANVREHADADHVVVTLHHDRDHVAVEVRDDGTGFTPGRTVAEPQRGFGLAAMRQRVHEHGGALTVDSTSGRGTVLAARIPLPAATRLSRARPATAG